ncbi:AAA family ATPase [Paenibacillus phoenicis]|uniref:AAA family ATPase n=1 Tax=Paenibacillus phoenicis TaxID=554117 RepID=A0ABU5PL27_9BACL|nr:AAA family ATPase [Paenibacillus phoenicis]MEA3570645.1 AAA family ATPase [Paenibacillus phoenicis]
MRVALFRLSQRQMWVDRIRRSGYEVKFVHDPERITSEMSVVVVDAMVGKWKDYVRLVQGREVPVVLLVEDHSDWGEQQTKSLGIAGTVTAEEETNGLFSRFIPACETERDATAALSSLGRTLVFQTEEAPFLPLTEMETAESQSVSIDVPLSQRKARQRFEVEPSRPKALSARVVPAPAFLEMPENGSFPYELPQTDNQSKPADTSMGKKNGLETENIGNEPEPAFTLNEPELTPHISRTPPDLPSVVAVYAAKGGVGKTTLLLHLAARLSKEGLRACIFDLDPNGTVATFMRIQPKKTVVDLVRRIDDPKARRACLLQTKAGFSIVAAPLLPGQFLLQPEELQAILHFLKEETNVVLLDLPVSLDRLTRLALEQADQLMLITTDEPASLFNLDRVKPFLTGLRPTPELYLVWNRLKEPAPKLDWKGRLPWPIVLELPEDPTVYRSVRSGEWTLSSPSSPYHVQVGRLVDRWMGRETASLREKRGWLPRLASHLKSGR